MNEAICENISLRELIVTLYSSLWNCASNLSSDVTQIRSSVDLLSMLPAEWLSADLMPHVDEIVNFVGNSMIQIREEHLTLRGDIAAGDSRIKALEKENTNLLHQLSTVRTNVF